MSQKGEATTLVLLSSLLVVVIGTVIGMTSRFGSSQSGFTRADEATGGCSYRAEAVVMKLDSNTPLLVSENGTTDNYGVANDFNLRTNPGKATGTFGRYDRNNDQIYDYFDDKPIDYSGTDFNIISKYVYHNDHLVFAPSEDKGVVDGMAISVTVFGLDETKWKITGQFCDQLKGSTKGCPTNLDKTSTSTTMSNIRPTCGTNIRYGWMVSPQDGVVVEPTGGEETGKCELEKEGCVPTITDVTYPTDNRIRVMWDNPTCSEAKLNEDVVGVEIKDGSGDIICSKKVQLNESDKQTDCKITRDNINNTKSVKKFVEGATYTATVFTATNDNSCKSPNSTGISEVYKKVTPTEVPEPTDKPDDGDPEPTNGEEDSCKEGKKDTDNKCNEACCTSDADCEKPGEACNIGNGGCQGQFSCGPQDNTPPPNTGEQCRTVDGNGPTRILFLPHGFNTKDKTYEQNVEEFGIYVSQAVQSMREANFGDLQKEFTFIAYDKFDRVYNCNNSSPFLESRVIRCNENQAMRDAKKECSATAILFISKLPGIYSYSSGTNIASVGYQATGTDKCPPGEPCSIGSVPHELGHAMPKGRLADEYDFGTTTSDQATRMNCSSGISCPWGEPCINTCGYRNWKRPSEKSQMNMYPNRTKDFNAPSLEAWRLALMDNRANDPIGQGATFLNAFETTASSFNQTLNLKIRQNQRGELSLGTILVENGYPTYLEQDLKEKFFTLKMIDDDLKTLYTGQVPTHEIHYEEGVGQKEFLREQINLHLPYYDNLASVELYDQTGLKKLDVDLDEYDIVVPTPVKNLCGNGVCDSRVSETPDSCFADCRPQNDYRNKYKELTSDINKDGTTNTLDCGVCLQEYKKTKTGMKCDIILDQKVNVLDYSTCIDNLGKKVQQSGQPTPTTQNAGPII